jgi:hypothetical protein
MFRGHQVDVVATAILEFEHHGGQPFRRRGRPPQLPTDFEVLAEDTAQIAAGEEDRPRASPAAEAVLLAVMRGITRYHGIASGPANREFVLEAVGPAVPRTARATAQDFEGAVDTAPHLTALK